MKRGTTLRKLVVEFLQTGLRSTRRPDATSLPVRPSALSVASRTLGSVLEILAVRIGVHAMPLPVVAVGFVNQLRGVRFAADIEERMSSSVASATPFQADSCVNL